MSITEILLYSALYTFGVILTMAAFGKVHRTSNDYISNEDKQMAIFGSLLLWPICLLVCLGILAYRKTNV